MKVYQNNTKDSVTIVQSVASASTMISSLALEMKYYIMSKFPKNFFRKIYVDTAETITEHNKNQWYNDVADKIPYPSMTITPEISLDDPIGAMQKSIHLSSPNLYVRNDVNRVYKKLVNDPDKRFSIHYTSDYITTNFNFKIVTSSFIQNTDMAFFLQSKFQRDFFQYLNGRYIQTEIPKSFIRAIADVYNWDLLDNNDMDELRMYLIGTSKSEQSIQKRLNLGTGKTCFFINEKVNLLTLLADLDCPSSVIRDSKVEGEYTITFRLQVSSWVPNAFLFSLNTSTLRKMKEETVDSFSSDEDDNGIYSTHIVFNGFAKKDTIYFKDDYDEQQIGHLLFHDTYTYKLNTPIPTIELMNRMYPEVKKVHSYAVNKLRLNLSTLIYPVLYSRNGRMTIDKDYRFNYENLTVDIPATFESDVSVALYINRAAYDSIKEAMKKDVNYFNDNYMTSMLVNIYGNTVRAIVRSFENTVAEYSEEYDRMLRIKTPYGIGYIALEDFDDSDDGYRICLGYDDDKLPIIKQIKIEE